MNKRHILHQNKLFLFILLFLAFYLSPLLHPQNFPAGPGDIYYYLWQADWFCPSLLQNNFFTDSVFFPHGVNLSGGYLSPLAYTLTCPFYHFGSQFILKLIFVLQISTLLLANTWVARRHLKNSWLQLSYIFLYSFSGFYLARIHQHIDLISTIWATAITYSLATSFNPQKLTHFITLALALAISFTSAWQNMPNLTPLVLILILPKLSRHLSTSPKFSTFIRHIFLSALAFAAIFLPLSWPMIQFNLTAPPIAPHNPSLSFSTTIANYLIPYHHLTSIFAPLIKNIAQSHFYLETINPIDLVILALAAFFILRQIRHKSFRLIHPTFILIMVYLLLSLGSTFTITGEPLFSLPYFKFLSSIPPFSFTRTPGRYGIVVVFLITLSTLKYLDTHLKSFAPSIRSKLPILLAIYSLLITTVFSQNLTLPTHQLTRIFPLKQLQQIQNDSDTFTLLLLPLMIGIDQSQSFIQHYTQKPLQNGYISHAIQTHQTLKTLSTDPILNQLECQEASYQLNPDPIERIAPTDFNTALQTHRIKYLIVFDRYFNHPNCQHVNHLVSPILNTSDSLQEITPPSSQFHIYQNLEFNQPDQS